MKPKLRSLALLNDELIRLRLVLAAPDKHWARRGAAVDFAGLLAFAEDIATRAAVAGDDATRDKLRDDILRGLRRLGFEPPQLVSPSTAPESQFSRAADPVRR